MIPATPYPLIYHPHLSLILRSQNGYSIPRSGSGKVIPALALIGGLP
jgi:hypothetical protein